MQTNHVNMHVEATKFGTQSPSMTVVNPNKQSVITKSSDLEEELKISTKSQTTPRTHLHHCVKIRKTTMSIFHATHSPSHFPTNRDKRRSSEPSNIAVRCNFLLKTGNNNEHKNTKLNEFLRTCKTPEG